MSIMAFAQVEDVSLIYSLPELRNGPAPGK
jgi:hypothetical protein